MNRKMPVLARVCTIVLLGALMGGCDLSQSETRESSPLSQGQLPSLNNINYTDESLVTGRKLTEVAGRASLPVLQNEQNEEVRSTNLQYAGRYYTQVPCQDAFVNCGKGRAEYILNLLPDGSAHRMIATFGRVQPGVDRPDIAQRRFYRKDHWSVDQAKNEIIVHLAEGLNFYYRVDPKQNLVMNLYKTLHANDQRVIQTFIQQHPLPEQPYKLVKDAVEF
ncbi:hypothetical protein ABLT88_04555 [Acinetobacter radioresistens]|jgi:hypothetical protein|uniref:hypothetical protein n=1 Tax=Acinetobacter radioresistens TaxID=40216 RepID=UPI0032B3BED5